MRDLDQGSLEEQWSCAASVRRYEHVAGADWIAVGNAAFAPDPLSGGGLWFALHSAAAAAAVVIGRSSVAAYIEEIEAQVRAHLTSRQSRLVPDGMTVSVHP